MEKIIDWENSAPKQVEIPFKPARVLLQVRGMSLVLGMEDSYTSVLHIFIFLYLVLFLGFYRSSSCG